MRFLWYAESASKRMIATGTVHLEGRTPRLPLDVVKVQETRGLGRGQDILGQREGRCDQTQQRCLIERETTASPLHQRPSKVERAKIAEERIPSDGKSSRSRGLRLEGVLYAAFLFASSPIADDVCNDTTVP
jgi:hypothetical protein